jgi:hypothetical protein
VVLDMSVAYKRPNRLPVFKIASMTCSAIRPDRCCIALANVDCLLVLFRIIHKRVSKA